ncbi:MAG TPA: hypothetical protein VLI41_14660 [Phenylobacterium sp.]|uniref:hypothetical protein n=1 Tax=Phenylobacterium sp. TaxID=1871053 RepID=UPI002D03ED0F|nr:hypothetical protein [Phenylobacterium sp.]HSV04434.1 hypothetical protein [Phenylobacterium sp.]
MPRILTTCPNTGALVSTGQRTPELKLAAMTLPHAFRCSACGQPHSWTAAQAIVETAPSRLLPAA